MVTIRRRMAIAIATGMHRALDLNETDTTSRRRNRRKHQIVVASVPPHAITQQPFAGFLPSLHKIMMYVRYGRASDFQIEVVAFCGTRMSRRSECIWIQVHPTDKRQFSGSASVNQPTLLVMTDRARRAVPADTEPRSALGEQFTLSERTRKRSAIADGFHTGSPENDTYIQPARGRAIEHVEQRSGLIRKAEGWQDECDRQPNTVTCGFDRLMDTPKCSRAINQRPYFVAPPCGIGPRRRKRNMRDRIDWCGRFTRH